MENTKQMEEFEMIEKGKMPIEEIVIYRDVDDMGRVFVTQPSILRFHLQQPPYKLVLDTGEQLFEISPQEAIYIIDHANNDYSPYKVRYQNFDFKNELVDEAQKHKRKPAKETTEVINIFRDVDDSGRAFVTIDVLRRFDLPMSNHKVLLGNTVVYEIDPVQAINIINNCNNKYAPYEICYVNIQFEKTISNENNQRKYMPVIETDKVKPVIEPHKVMPYIETDKIMPYIAPQASNRKIKPRARKQDETDEHYVTYLEGFYDCLLGYTQEEQDTRQEQEIKGKTATIPNPRNRKNFESDEEYVNYLKEYYHRMFKQEDLDKVPFKNLVQHRKKTEDMFNEPTNQTIEENKKSK